MNANEAKSILLVYRPGLADVEDPQTTEALALAQREPELAHWLAEHCARHEALRGKFRQITVPAGLKEQIISEQAAGGKMILSPRKLQLAAAVFAMLLLGTLAIFWFPQRAADDTLAVYKNQMARVALSPYAMDLLTNDPAAVRSYLAKNHAPADFILPAPLQQTTLTGCAVENWQGVKVSMICFRTGKPLAPGVASDLWLFVVDRAAVKKVPEETGRQIAKVNRLITATWTEGGKLYLLGTSGEEVGHQTISVMRIPVSIFMHVSFPCSCVQSTSRNRPFRRTDRRESGWADWRRAERRDGWWTISTSDAAPRGRRQRKRRWRGYDRRRAGQAIH